MYLTVFETAAYQNNEQETLFRKNHTFSLIVSRHYHTTNIVGLYPIKIYVRHCKSIFDLLF